MTRWNTKKKPESSRPIGPYEAICDVLHYLTYSKRNRTAKAKALPHPLLPPAQAGRKEGENHAAWKKLHRCFDQNEDKTTTTLNTIGEISNEFFFYYDKQGFRCGFESKNVSSLLLKDETVIPSTTLEGSEFQTFTTG